MFRQKVRVLFIDGSIGFGGAPKSLSLLLAGLQDMVEPILITSASSRVIDDWFKGVKVIRNVSRVNYESRVQLNAWVGAMMPAAVIKKLVMRLVDFVEVLERFLNALQILRICICCKVELVHMNTGSSPVEGLLVARLLNVPSISHMRGFFVRPGWIRTKALQSTSHIIGVSNAVSRSVRENKDFERVTTIYDPVDIGRYENISSRRAIIRGSLGINDTDITVAIFGRVVPWKGQLVFVHACVAALKKNLSIKALIVGDQSDSDGTYFEGIKRLIAESGFGDRFILTGFREDVENLYAAADIIVHASVEPEPFGMVVPEGMAAGKPVIAADAGGPSEIIKNGIDGVLVPPGNIEVLAAAIDELAGDSAKREIIGKNGYNKVRTEFTVEHISSQVLNIYTNALTCRRD